MHDRQIQLRPYDHDPRTKRATRFTIKSICPPAASVSPGRGAGYHRCAGSRRDHYIIRNGGNTRLAILRELQVGDRQRQRLLPHIVSVPTMAGKAGEIVALTASRRRNELRVAASRSSSTRALGVEKAFGPPRGRAAPPWSQSELARRLAADYFRPAVAHHPLHGFTVQAICRPPFPPCLAPRYRGPAVGRARLQTHRGYRRHRRCRWTSTAFFRRCWRSSTRRATSSAAAARKTS